MAWRDDPRAFVAQIITKEGTRLAQRFATLPLEGMDMQSRNIASNLPAHWRTGGKLLEDDTTGPYGISCQKFAELIRAKMIEQVKGFADAFVDEIEAQLHYNEHKNEKKSNPSAFYEARDRLFAARHKVKAFHDDPSTQTTIWMPLLEDLKREKLAHCASPADAFKAWLFKEVQLYATALQHPERVFRLCSPDTDVYEQRYALLAQALHTYSADGLDVAYKLWKDELEERYAGIQSKGHAAFESFNGKAKRYDGKKDGKWNFYETGIRPIIVTDPAEIQRNQEWIDSEPERRKRDQAAYDRDVRGIGKPSGVPGKPSKIKSSADAA